jgi:hypothetical protein
LYAQDVKYVPIVTLAASLSLRLHRTKAAASFPKLVGTAIIVGMAHLYGD